MTRTGSKTRRLLTQTIRLATAAALAAAMAPISLPFAYANVVPTTYWVDGAVGDNANPGTEVSPFRTITHAAAVAGSLDTIMVQPGTYSSPRGETWPIAFDGETLISTEGATSTTIQGDLNAQLFGFSDWTEGDALSGFTIRDGGLSTGGAAVRVSLGTATSDAMAPVIADCVFLSNAGYTGGGLVVFSGAGTNLVVRGSVFTGCSAQRGGGIHAQCSGDLVVSGCAFSGNTAAYGGGMQVETSGSGTVVIEHSAFTANRATETGGAIELDGTSSSTWQTVRDNDFTGNAANFHGGAIYSWGSSFSAARNTAGANTAGFEGGFAYLQSAHVTASNNYLVQNEAAFSGAAWRVDASSTLTEINDTVIANGGCPITTNADSGAVVTILNCIYWSADGTSEARNVDSISYTCSGDDSTTLLANTNLVGAGMVYADPQLNAANFPALLDISPCIEAGSPADWASPDLFGTARPQDFDGDRAFLPDIGCYEAPGVPVPVYRFYNPRLGVHFYTASEAEKNNVIATLGSTYTFEGAAYSLNPPANTQPLHRFFNRRVGVHFYTASETEKANVQATLGHIYTYEGVAYNVSMNPAAGPTAYRFYRPSTGTHFYTADETEKANVQATLGHIFTYEGPAFYLGQ